MTKLYLWNPFCNLSPPAAGPVQTVRPRPPPGWRPPRRAGVARQRPGCSGAGSGACWGGHGGAKSAVNVLSAYLGWLAIVHQPQRGWDRP
jgi:hypothetical protein